MTPGHGPFRPLLVLLAVLVAALAAAAPAAAGPPRAVIAFFPLAEDLPEDAPPQVPILDRFEAVPDVSLGLTGATQGRYTVTQALLDMSQGTRTSAGAYDPERVPELELAVFGREGIHAGWLDARARAETAPADVVPGLLGQTVPGGVAYAGVRDAENENAEAIVAADRRGRIQDVSLGRSDDVAARALRLLRDHRLVVVGLPGGFEGDAQMRRLRAARGQRDLLLVLQTPPGRRAPQLLPTIADGLARGGDPGMLTSRTTRLEGVVAGIDVAPTVLHHLGVGIPDEMTGQRITVQGSPDAEALRDLESRLRVVGPRRFPALQTLLAVWLVTMLVASLIADRRGTRWAMRAGALALLWMPAVLLLTAALRPSRTLELALVAGVSFLAGALTDRFVRWPRGPLVPCAVSVLAYVADLARGSDLIIRSLLGPNPRFGSRYYGIGNELEATLPVLLLLALAVGLMALGRSRRAAVIAGVCGGLLGAAIGWGRMGADVGGAPTIGAGVAVTVLLLLPGELTRRRVLVALAIPALALAALAVLDLVTGGDGHFTRTVLEADDEGAIWDSVSRRYGLAWDQLMRGLMPLAAAVALLAISWAVKYRERLYAPLEGSASWRAALVGGLAAGLAGTLFNDSGPVLLIFSTAVLAVATIYVRGDPRLAQSGLLGPGSGAEAR
ncbi:MAG TPA: hypothetical protein VD931_01750 [Baekduia sp.]|nr:hypothetical protein [Baekduia sp.]